MAELTKKLRYMTDSGASGAITLYSTPSEAGDNRLNLSVDGSDAYAPLGGVSDNNASPIKVLKDNKTYSVLLNKMSGSIPLKDRFIYKDCNGISGYSYEYVIDKSVPEDDWEWETGYVDEYEFPDGLDGAGVTYWEIPKHPDCNKISIVLQNGYSSEYLHVMTFLWSDILSHPAYIVDSNTAGIIVQYGHLYDGDDGDSYHLITNFNHIPHDEDLGKSYKFYVDDSFVSDEAYDYFGEWNEYYYDIIQHN